MADGSQFAFTPAVEAATSPMWEKVKHHVTPMEWRLHAPLIAEINRLKREKNAVILTHSYVAPEIIYGVGDYKGDSYYLSDRARAAKADVIVFAGVVFMAETAKILCPQARVYVPDRGSGCSLADSITGEDVRRLKALYPGAPVVCYINSTAEVKAESDVCVTSSNVYDIVAKLPGHQILFVPDRLMGDNLRNELRRRGIDKEIISSDGTCLVHEEFTPEQIAEARALFPGLAVVAHPECPPEVAALADFVGSTTAMMKYVQTSHAPYYLMLTECGLVGRLQVESPEKAFIGGCRLCPYMKLNTLEKIREALTGEPRPEYLIEIDEDVRVRAARSIHRMFEMTSAAA